MKVLGGNISPHRRGFYPVNLFIVTTVFIDETGVEVEKPRATQKNWIKTVFL